MVRVPKGSRQDGNMGLAPSERALKIIGIDLRKLSFDGHGPEILGALPLAEGGGAKHSPPGHTWNGCTWENVAKIIKNQLF